MTFSVGQKVVYIGGERVLNEWGPTKTGLRKGQVCTIREVDARYIRYFGCVGIRVDEDIQPLVAWAGGLIEPADLAIRFRPVIGRKTDTGMAVLRKLLNTKQHADLLPQE